MVSFDVPITGQRVNTNRPVGGVVMPVAVGAIAVMVMFLIFSLGSQLWDVAGGVLPGQQGGGIPVAVNRVND